MVKVAIVRVDERDILKGVKRIFELLGRPDLPVDAKIAIKLNLCYFKTFETGATSDPRVVEALITYFKEEFPKADISLVEADATSARQDLLFKWLGFQDLARKHGVKCVNVSKEDGVEVEVKGKFLKKVRVPKTVLEADYLVNLAKMKTHLLTKITCALKNVYGLDPYPRKIEYHKSLDNAIVDLNTVFKPHLHFVDGLIAMEGEKGPLYGRPKKLGVFVAGSDPVAVDATCARIMGFNPRYIGHIRKAARRGLGTMDPEIVGESIENVKDKFEFRRLHAYAFRFAQFLRGIRR